MKKNRTVKTLLFWLFVSFVSNNFAHNLPPHLSICIQDDLSKEVISDAVISVGNEYYLSDDKGCCQFTVEKNKPEYIFIQLLGYEIKKNALLDIIANQPYTIYLKSQVNLLSEIVVDGRDQSSTRNTVSQGVSSKDINKNVGSSMASSLENVKGISFIQSGTRVAKPVIQGMHSNRILIINNGVRQKGQAWGDDHAPELDLNNAEYVTVIKGAEAVRYGSQAMGGVLKLESRQLPYARKGIKGNLSSSYGSNGKTFAGTGYMDGSVPFNRDFAWRVQGTYINGGDRSTANYLLNNTGLREINFSGSLGYLKPNYGIDLFYSSYNSRMGVLYTAQRGDIDLLKERIAIGRPLDITPFSRHIDYPNQHVIHQITRLKTFYRFENNSKLNFQYAYQTDARDEFHLRRNNLSHIPSLSLDLTSHQLDLDWTHSFNRIWKTEVGLHSTFTNNVNQSGTGVVPVIPNFTQQSAGIFALQKLTKEKWGVEAGVRFDYENNKADGFDSYGQRYGGGRKFSNFTYNLGGNYQLSSKWNLVTNLGLAYRAPHVHELYSNGLDHASGIYMMGDMHLDSERSTKWITSINYKSSQLAFSVDGFVQGIDNYIYDEPSQEYMTVVSGTYPVFKFKQVHAYFRGVDAELSVQPLSNISYAVNGGVIWANEQDTDRYLPYIPSFKLMQSVGYTIPKWNGCENIDLSINHKYVAKQNRFDPETDLLSYSPSSYHLFGLEMRFTIPIKGKNKLTFIFEANNLFNKEYKEYTNRFRYYAHDAGRDLRLVAIWNF